MKKLCSLILAFVMVMSLGLTAFAADDVQHTITIKNEKAGHEYAAFRIFKGDLDANETKLSDIVWGESITDADALLAAIKSIADRENKPFANCNDAAGVAEVLAKYANDSVILDTFAKVAGKYLVANDAAANVWKSTEKSSAVPNCVYTITVPGDGYYLVKDTKSYNGAVEDAATKFILQVVDDVNVDAKDDTVTQDKAIRKASGETFELVHQDDYNVGDTINFQITGDIPNMDGYETYEYVAYDKMTSGITPVDVDNDGNIDVEVSIVTLDANKKVVETHKTLNSNEYTFLEKGDYTFKLSIDNFLQYKKYAGKHVLITYSGVLNENALITKAETNESFIEYSNNPNDGSKGRTTTTVVHVFDFDLNIDKWANVNDTNTKLANAKFVLYKLGADNTPLFYKWVEDENENTKDGHVEWVSVVGYSHSETANNVANEDVLKAAKDGVITEKVTDDNGDAKFAGLDTGTYYLLETDAPDGYNTLETTVEVKIAATYDVDGNITGENIQYDNNNQPYVEQGIENKAGTTLPSTGGIGTTIFYVVGIVLMAGAAVVLIARRRAR